jgi:hypothetical protein
MSDGIRASPPGDSVEGQILLTSKSALSITRVEIRFIGTLGCYLICPLLDKTIDLQRVFVIPTDLGICDQACKQINQIRSAVQFDLIWILKLAI